jgi:hypothetical protein
MGAAVVTAVGDSLRTGSGSMGMTACMAASWVERGRLSWTRSLAETLPTNRSQGPSDPA